MHEIAIAILIVGFLGLYIYSSSKEAERKEREHVRDEIKKEKQHRESLKKEEMRIKALKKDKYYSYLTEKEKERYLHPYLSQMDREGLEAIAEIRKGPKN